MEITKKTTLDKILDKKGGEDILAKHGVPCVSCPMAKLEMNELQIGQICKMYGIDEDKLLKDLNKK